jgi:hypothetical protein
MKSKKFEKKLSLNKKTISNLNQGAMKGVRGGGTLEIACFDPGGGSALTNCQNTCDCTDESICFTNPCKFCLIP